MTGHPASSQIRIDPPLHGWTVLHVEEFSLLISFVPTDPLQEIVDALRRSFAHQSNATALLHTEPDWYELQFGPDHFQIVDQQSGEVCLHLDQSLRKTARAFLRALTLLQDAPRGDYHFKALPDLDPLRRAIAS